MAFNAANAHEATLLKPLKPPFNLYEGDLAGRQLSEPVEAFLARCPPLTTHISDLGPWIYIANPHTNFRPNEDRAAFVTCGSQLLKDYGAERASREVSMAGKSKQTITKKLTPLRKRLETDLFAAARQNRCTSGKWMLFPPPDDVNSWWSIIARGTLAGELGHAAKVATDGASAEKKARLICVYTHDFEDTADVKRVLESLEGMGLVKKKGPMGDERGIYYKADAYTHLDIMGGNKWGLKASLYSSKDMLAEHER